MKKKLFWMGCLAMSLSLGACSVDDDDDLLPEDTEQTDPDDDGDEEESAEDIANKQAIQKLFKSIYRFSFGSTTDSMMAYIAKMPTGVYTFDGVEESDKRVFVKTADGGAMLLNPTALSTPSNMVGNTIQGPNWLVGPETTGYMYYNDEWSDGSFAPNLHAYKYTKRDADWQNAINEQDAYLQMHAFLYAKFGNSMLDNVEEQYYSYKLNSEDADLSGIPCTHYYFTYKDEWYAALVGNVFDLWVDKNGLLLAEGVQGKTLATFTFKKIADASFEKTFSTMMGELNNHGSFEMSDCILSTKVYKNSVPADVAAVGVHFVPFDGAIKYYDVTYRPWKTMGGFTGISFVARNVSEDDAEKYTDKVKALNLCTVNNDMQSGGYIIYEASNWDCTEAPLGETVCYPAYKIIYNSDTQILTVEYTENRVLGV